MPIYELFYETVGWNKEADKKLINILKMQRIAGLSHRTFETDLPPAFLTFFTHRLNDLQYSNYSETAIQSQIHKMKIRYAVFDYITKRNGVAWNEDNVLWATDEEWEQIMLVHPLARAYMSDRSGDEEWDNLKKIFGGEDEELDTDDISQEDMDDDGMIGGDDDEW